MNPTDGADCRWANVLYDKSPFAAHMEKKHPDFQLVAVHYPSRTERIMGVLQFEVQADGRVLGPFKGTRAAAGTSLTDSDECKSCRRGYKSVGTNKRALRDPNWNLRASKSSAMAHVETAHLKSFTPFPCPMLGLDDERAL